jgi:hypothetical protein
VSAVYGLRGKGHLDRQLRGYNNAARFSSWLVLRDLDTDALCAPDLVHRMLPDGAANMRFRIAVKAVESWLMADLEGFSHFIGVPRSIVPINSEGIADPKRAPSWIWRAVHRKERYAKISCLRQELRPL